VILTAIALFLPIAVYIIAGLSPNATAKDTTDYLVGGKRVGQNDYANTSVGYALQMAAVFLFASWGILYGIGALWASLFWSLGYFLLYFLLPRFIEYHSQNEPITLHEYLRAKFRAGRGLQVLAAGATITGLMGAMLAEVDYVVLVLQPVSERYSTLRPIILQAVFLLLGLSYIIWNGFKAEVRAERIQVPIAYCCLLVTLFFLLPGVWRFSGPRAFYPTVLILALALIVMTAAKIDWSADKRGVSRFPDKQIFIPIGALLVLTTIMIAITTFGTAGTNSSVFEIPIATQLKAQGWLGVFSLLLANALWMPIDLSTWQRIASVDRSNVLQVLRSGTARVALESPAGWFCGAVLGWCIHSSGVLAPGADASSAITVLSSYLFAGSIDPIKLPIGSIIYATFLAGAVAVMLSTVNSIMAAIAYTVERDLLGSNKTTLWRLRIVTIITLILGFAAYEFLRIYAGANLQTLLYGAYAAQLSLVVIVFVALYEIRISARGAIGSLSLGLTLAGLYVAFAIKVQDQRAFVLPPLFAIAGSVIGYAMFYRTSDNQTEAMRP